MTDPHHILEHVFGFSGYRPGQQAIVEAVLGGEDVLAVMPTGGGKSLCYQLPALAREGLTLVVSPLIALMRDQVAQLRRNGVEAGSLSSANDEEERSRVAEAVRAGRLKLLYASPERLALPATLDWLARSDVKLLAIDEAHCVSQWGHDFRPEYALLGDVRRQLGGVQTMALTATADVATREDIVRRLFQAPPRTFIHGFDRPNIRLAMQAKDNARRQILRFVERHRGQSGIVYCATRKDTEAFAQALSDSGFNALPYHAGLDAAARSRNQDAFLQEDGMVMAATVAFGMGIDKPDVRFVAHAALPKSIEAYYQEIGRAGRDGLPADTLTLYGLDDIRLRRLQIEEGEASEDQKRIERQRLNALIALAEAPRCRRQTLLSYFAEASEPCGRCDLCEGGVKVFDGTVEAQKILSAAVRTGERFGAEHLVAVLAGEETEAVLRAGHQGLKTFGVGKDRPKGEWRSLIRQVYALGLMQMDITSYGSFALTERGWAVLKGAERVELRADVLQPRESTRSRREAARQEAGLPADHALLAALKALRLEIAKAESVPAYVVFTDKSLIDMASLRPRDPYAMRLVHGVGDAKLARYGEAFLAVIAGHTG
ncbi:DNA helicase RecQ [Labrys wisconsinensis]|uniref:DNA helicase RecQ n=1 Tax=Labrys wisconsinensis TaxID=425677 RepID=A0ABU0J157_9HYPH|nr:DNA helicase RecQ [Labrys wisconsinensis]MDQ0467997.1 ATP-dependent DNA helicase RecQ [Labrys wisconsinensis]